MEARLLVKEWLIWRGNLCVSHQDFQDIEENIPVNKLQYPSRGDQSTNSTQPFHRKSTSVIISQRIMQSVVFLCEVYSCQAGVGIQIGMDHFLLGLALVSLANFLLKTSTLYLSKSVKFCLRCCLAKALPMELSAYFLATPSLAMAVLTFPVLAPRPILRSWRVSWSLRMGMTCLWISSPSTRTRLSLRMSTMVASLPSRGPQLILATRPTQTNLLQPCVRVCVPLLW